MSIEAFTIPENLKDRTAIIGYKVLEKFHQDNELEEVLTKIPPRLSEVLRLRTSGKILTGKQGSEAMGISEKRFLVLERLALDRIQIMFIRERSIYDYIAITKKAL